MNWGGWIGIGGIAAVTAVVVTGDEVRNYPVPVSVARERLASTPLPEALSGMGGAVSMSRQEHGLRWRLGDPDRQSEARVSLEGDGATTNVTIHFDLSDKALGGSRLAATGLTKALAESIFTEHVDAVLGGRSFDQRRMALGAARELQANPNLLKEYGEAIRQDMLDTAKLLENQGSSIESVPVDYPGSATRVDPKSYKPMTNPGN